MVTKINKTQKSTEGLRDLIFEQLDKLVNGEIDVEQAKAVSRMSDSIMKTVTVDMTAQRMAAKAPGASTNPVKKLNLTLSRSDEEPMVN